MSATSQTPVPERQILIVGPYGVLGTGVIERWPALSKADHRASVS